MFSLTEEYFSDWVDSYGQAWIDGDADAIAELYAQDAEYYETPYEDHFLGLEAIRKYWTQGAGISQKDVKFSYNVLAVMENSGLAQFWASFLRIPSGNFVELDGIILAEFNEGGKCHIFREWWHRREMDKKGIGYEN